MDFPEGLVNADDIVAYVYPIMFQFCASYDSIIIFSLYSDDGNHIPIPSGKHGNGKCNIYR